MKLHVTVAVCGLLAAGSAHAQQKTLNLYNWGNYTSPALLEKFEKETGVKVVVTDYDSNDTALTKVEAGGHGFDLVVPSANYLPIWVEKGLIVKPGIPEMPNYKNIDPKWRDVAWDPGREWSVPWQWGVTGVAVNTSIYKGDVNTSAIWLEPPPELQGKINVTPEMNDIISMAIKFEGGEVCTEDKAILRKVRDRLVAAKPHWMSMDYGMTEKMASADVSATVYWNGAMLRSRIENPAVAFGYPKEGFPIFMDSVALLRDAQNVEEAKSFMNFIMAPENAAMISNFARYANGIAGSEQFLDKEMQGAPELAPPAELADRGYFLTACPQSAQQLYVAIWTELQK